MSAANCRGTGGLGRASGGGEIEVHEVRSPRSTCLSLTQLLKVVTGLYPYPLTHTHARCPSPHLSTHPFQNVQRELLHACRKKMENSMSDVKERNRRGIGFSLASYVLS